MIAQALLALIVWLAFLVEAALGFGCNVLAVTLGAHLVPLTELVPVLVLLNLVVSTTIVLRHRADIAWRVLLGRILPLMLLGLPGGMALFGLASSGALQLGFGLFVALLAALELLRRRPAAAARPLPPWVGVLALVGAGVMHGLYAAGGPLTVYYAGRELPEKGRFRSTLSMLWLVLNAVLLASHLARRMVTRAMLERAGLLLVPLVGGIVAGEWLHGRIAEALFRRLIYSLLLVGGAALVLAALR